MSADNGVYIMKFKDQYRVLHMQAVDNLEYSYCINDGVDYVPTRLVEYYGDTKYTYDYQTALRVASAILRKLPVCEYGIQILNYPYTWKQTVEKAKEYVLKEIEAIEHRNCSWELKEIPKLKSLLCR
jgi:hypothetical protein